MPDSLTPLIDAQHAAFMQSGVSICIAGCNDANRPSVSRATGCRIAADLLSMKIFASREQAQALIDDVRNNGAFAVVFSDPPTHRTIQLKGKDARILPLDADEFAIVEQYRHAFVRTLEPLGYEPAMIYAVLSCPPEDIVAIQFTPNAAFTQTPGPRAGEPLKASAS